MGIAHSSAPDVDAYETTSGTDLMRHRRRSQLVAWDTNSPNAKPRNRFQHQHPDGFATVAGAWLIATIFGGLLIHHCRKHVFLGCNLRNSLRLTTTGATVITDELIARNGAPLAEFIAKHITTCPKTCRYLTESSSGDRSSPGSEESEFFFVLLILPLLKVGKSMQYSMRKSRTQNRLRSNHAKTRHP